MANFNNATGDFFTPNQSLVVDGLGYFDVGAKGLEQSHDVGIFIASNATAVALAVVAAGTVEPLISGSRFVPIAPATLSAATKFYIEADNNTTDQCTFGTGAVIYNPALTWNGFGDSNSNSIFGTVTNIGGQTENLGPNFLFVTSVPEPSSLVLGSVCVLAALGCAGYRHRLS